MFLVQEDFVELAPSESAHYHFPFRYSNTYSLFWSVLFFSLLPSHCGFFLSWLSWNIDIPEIRRQIESCSSIAIT